MTEVLLAPAPDSLPEEIQAHGSSLGLLDPGLVRLVLRSDKPVATEADGQEASPDDFEIIEKRRLMGLPSDGFPEGSNIKERLIDGLQVIGQSTRNINSFGFGPDETDKGKRQPKLLGTWGGDKPEDVGRLTIFPYLLKLPPEAFPETAHHEMSHGNTAFNATNAYLHGGEEQRLAHVETVMNIAQQSLATGVFLDGYQASLAEQLAQGEIDWARFVVETEAIAVTAATYRREELRQKQAAQHAEFAKRRRAGLLPDDMRPVDLLSSKEPGVPVAGIDAEAIALVSGKGVTTPDELAAHGVYVKKHFYSPEGRTNAEQRRSRRLGRRALALAA